jgi:glycosyltransferase involved in cell wall biosynthesis
MKILTIGASPYLLVRNGRIHADVINALKADGHEVSAAVWHHDEGYFMPSEEGIHAYEKDGKNVCQLYPFTPKTDEASPFVYELMKLVQPQVVITIGDYKDTNFLYAIKAMYPSLFKWIAIYTFDASGILRNNKDAFEYTDYVISTSEFGWNELSSFATVQGQFFPYGPDHSKFVSKGSHMDRRFMLCSARNAQSSNIPAFIEGVAKLPATSVIHTNLYDVGDYSLESLKERYKADGLFLPTYYCSIKEGLSDDGMAGIYNETKAIVDCSLKSATALSLLEGMACGCIPVGPAYGRVGEIISQMPEGFQYYVSYNTFIGQNEEEFAIISPADLGAVLSKILALDIPTLCELSAAASEISKKFSNTAFINNLRQVIETVSLTPLALALDSL